MQGFRVSPLRLRAIGLSAEDVATLYGITLKQLEAMVAEAEAKRRPEPAPAGKALMTKLLMRPEMDKWETRKAER